MKKINIHFVCRGNVYRSRLAEAYLKSFEHPNWHITSSGVGADRHRLIHTSPWAQMLANHNGFRQFLTGTNKKTTQEDLDDADLIVFMGRDVYRDAKSTFIFEDDKALVWSVKDREDWSEEMSPLQKRKGTFRQIKRHVDTLKKDMLAGGNWVDVVDERNQSRGFMLPIVIANQKGVWHRGCHVVATTPGGKTFIQQRSKRIVFAPSMIDVTLGGHVDTGEYPEEAAAREANEEMGWHVSQDDMKLIDVSRWNYYHPHYKRRTRVFLYTYHLPLKEENPTVAFQEEEVSAVRLLSPVQLRRLLRIHRLTRGVKLGRSYAYYARIAKLVHGFR